MLVRGEVDSGARGEGAATIFGRERGKIGAVDGEEDVAARHARAPYNESRLQETVHPELVEGPFSLRTRREEQCFDKLSTNGKGVVRSCDLVQSCRTPPPKGRRFNLSVDALVDQLVLGDPWQDRKSVVKGKSVAVSVDIEGRRVLKKKNKQNES